MLFNVYQHAKSASFMFAQMTLYECLAYDFPKRDKIATYYLKNILPMMQLMHSEEHDVRTLSVNDQIELIIGNIFKAGNTNGISTLNYSMSVGDVVEVVDDMKNRMYCVCMPIGWSMIEDIKLENYQPDLSIKERLHERMQKLEKDHPGNLHSPGVVQEG